MKNKMVINTQKKNDTVILPMLHQSLQPVHGRNWAKQNSLEIDLCIRVLSMSIPQLALARFGILLADNALAATSSTAASTFRF